MAIPDPRGDPQQGPANWTNGFLPAVYQGTAFNAERPISHLARPREIAPGDDRAARDFLRLLNDEHLKRTSRRHRALGPDRRLRAGRPDAARAPRRSATCRARARRPARSTASTTPTRSRPASAATACSPAGCWSAACGSSRCSTAPSPWAKGVLNWDGHRRIKSDYNRHGPILDKPAAALLIDLKARGTARRHAGRLDHRVRPHAHVSEGDAGPRPQPQGLHRLARRRGRQARVQLRRHPTSKNAEVPVLS